MHLYKDQYFYLNSSLIQSNLFMFYLNQSNNFILNLNQSNLFMFYLNQSNHFIFYLNQSQEVLRLRGIMYLYNIQSNNLFLFKPITGGLETEGDYVFI